MTAAPHWYRKLPSGLRCRCIHLWQDGDTYYCCRGASAAAFDKMEKAPLLTEWLRGQAAYLRDLDSGSVDAVRIDEAVETIERQMCELKAWRDRFPTCEYDSASGSIYTNRPPV